MKDSRMNQETLHAISAGAEKTTIAAAGASLTGTAFGSFILAYGGFIVGVLGVLVVVIFKILEHNENKRHHKVIEAKPYRD
jgi:hypothetical protein